MNTKFIVRCDVDYQNGFGHFSRCLNLVRAIKKAKPEAQVTFLGTFNEYAQGLIKKYGMSAIEAPVDTVEQIKLAQDYDCFILDTYLIDQNYVDQLTNQRFKFLRIDDFNDIDLEKADLVVNFAVRANTLDYKTKKKCLGVKYFPVREELKNLRQRNIGSFKDEVNHILVYLGASDLHDVGEQVVDILDQMISNKQVTLISSKVSNKEEVSKHNNHIVYSSEFKNIEDILGNTDLVITGGGLIKYDCAYCCIPNAALSQTPEQDAEVKTFGEAGLTYYLNRAEYFEQNRKEIAVEIKQFMSMEERKKLFEKAQTVFETDSTDNLAQEIINL